MQTLHTNDFFVRVEDRRKELNMSKAELCMHIGCSRSNYYFWLTNAKDIVLGTAFKLSTLLNVPIVKNNSASESIDDVNTAKHDALLQRAEATEYILQLLNDGFTKADICIAFQTTTTTINQLLLKHNMATDGYKRKLK